MSGGRKEVQFNSLERAVSTDLNRMQKFAGTAFAEFFRFLMNASSGTDDTDAAGVMTQFTTQGTPLGGEILNGLAVKPQTGAGVLDLQVDPGCVMVLNPDAAPDDSNYKFVLDPGIASNGVLQMTANASGSPRIDVVEIQPASVITETDNRDQYNPATGLFTTSTVTKAREMRAAGGGTVGTTIRVRAGTPGSGFPGVTNGWMPLMVAYVPAGATANDAMTFWDVRPLVADREFGLANTQRSTPLQVRGSSSMSPNAGSASPTLNGLYEATFKGRRVGGQLRRGTPGSDAASGVVLGPGTSDNVDPTTVFNPNVLVFLYLAFPSTLPRWARYTDGPGTRQPRSPRGIPLLSGVGPKTDGTPSANLTFPTAMGLSTTQNAVCIAAYFCNGAGSQLFNMTGEKNRQYVQGIASDFNAVPPNTPAIAPAVSTVAHQKYNLVANTHFPANAKRLLVSTSFAMTAAGVYYYQKHFNAYYPSDSTNAYASTDLGGGICSGSARTEAWMDWVPTPQVYPTTTPSATSFTLEAYTDAVGTSGFTSSNLYVVGWEF